MERLYFGANLEVLREHIRDENEKGSLSLFEL
jgi:hypothetical protein